jgi:hypothetical protein
MRLYRHPEGSGETMMTLAELARESDLLLIRNGEFRCLLRFAHDEGLHLAEMQAEGIDPQRLCEPRSKWRRATDRVLGRLKIAFRRENLLAAPR